TTGIVDISMAEMNRIIAGCLILDTDGNLATAGNITLNSSGAGAYNLDLMVGGNQILIQNNFITSNHSLVIDTGAFLLPSTGSINTGSATPELQAQGWDINIGGTIDQNDDPWDTFDVSMAEMNRITAGTLSIYDQWGEGIKTIGNITLHS